MKYLVRVGSHYPDPKPDPGKLASLRERTRNPGARLEVRLEEGQVIADSEIPRPVLEQLVASNAVEPWTDPKSVSGPAPVEAKE